MPHFGWPLHKLLCGACFRRQATHATRKPAGCWLPSTPPSPSSSHLPLTFGRLPSPRQHAPRARQQATHSRHGMHATQSYWQRATNCDQRPCAAHRQTSPAMPQERRWSYAVAQVSSCPPSYLISPVRPSRPLAIRPLPKTRWMTGRDVLKSTPRPIGKRRATRSGEHEEPPTIVHPSFSSHLRALERPPRLSNIPHEPVVKRRAQDVACGMRNCIPVSCPDVCPKTACRATKNGSSNDKSVAGAMGRAVEQQGREVAVVSAGECPPPPITGHDHPARSGPTWTSLTGNHLSPPAWPNCDRQPDVHRPDETTPDKNELDAHDHAEHGYGGPQPARGSQCALRL